MNDHTHILSNGNPEDYRLCDYDYHYDYGYGLHRRSGDKGEACKTGCLVRRARQRIMRLRQFMFLGVWILCGRLEAGSIVVTVKDGKGALVSDAVVYAKSKNPTVSPDKKQAVIEQRDKEFFPYVTAVQVRTSLSFPNNDTVRHDVYSLSPAKEFELPLYAGASAQPVTFDKEGFVTLGCNIHDWMVAYIAVLATPYFKVTGKDGRAVLEGLPAGEYSVEVWQPLLKVPPEKSARHIDLAEGSNELLFTLDLKPDFRAKRPSS